jgi:hypothetical protein
MYLNLVTKFGGFILSKGTAVDHWRSPAGLYTCTLQPFEAVHVLQ